MSIFFCPGESNFDKDQVKFPCWKFDLSIGITDWYNPNGANDKSEFAGQFDIRCVNNPGPVLATEELSQSVGSIIYPNPNVTCQLYVYIRVKPFQA